jgi:vacuolar iron transporter family protein
MLTRSLDKAREAYLNKDKKASIAAHSQKSADEKHQQGSGQYLKSAIYGGLDGTITTFSVVAGVTGASLSTGVILIMGFANLVGDGISMAIGDVLSTKSEQEYHKAERKREQWEAENYPEGEKRELVQIYMSKGVTKPDAEKMVETISKHKNAWLDIMMVEELGMIEPTQSPLKNSLVTFGSFCVFGFVPVLAYVVSKVIPAIKPFAFPAASALTALTLFTLGAVKTKLTNRRWYVSGLEMMLVGSVAAGAAYLIGVLLGGLA